MKLVLRSPVEHLGQVGDVVTVKAGYARNYLLPQGLAYVASEANVRRFEQELGRRAQQERRDHLEAHRRASLLEGLSVSVRARAGSEGQLFGSVSERDIHDLLGAQDFDFEVDRRSIILSEPIKSVGEHLVSVRLGPTSEAQIRVLVEAEEV